MSSVGVVVVEDGLKGLGRLGDEGVLADVDPFVGVGGEDLESSGTKGPITASA